MYRSLAAIQEFVKATFPPVVNIVLEGGIPDKASSGVEEEVLSIEI